MATVTSWSEAEAAVRSFACDLPIYWGTGNPIYRPCVIAVSRDAWNDGRGYSVTRYPEGEGYGKPSTHLMIDFPYPDQVS